MLEPIMTTQHTDAIALVNWVVTDAEPRQPDDLEQRYIPFVAGHTTFQTYGLAYELVDRAAWLRGGGHRAGQHWTSVELDAMVANAGDVITARALVQSCRFSHALAHASEPLARSVFNEVSLEGPMSLMGFLGSLSFDLLEAHIVAHRDHGGCHFGNLRPALN